MTIALTLLAGPARGQAEEAPEVKLEEAFYLEVAAADPGAAVKAYQDLLADPSLPPRLAARAHLRLGISYRNLGRADRAREHFEAIAESYAAETDAVKIARRHLGEESLDDPARFLPADVLFYAELVEPGEHIRGLSELLEGTPFQNPVDYYVTYLTQAAPESTEPAPGTAGSLDASPAAAFLNEGFLRELEKVEALAVAIPGARTSESDFLLIVDHGRSNILRGLVQMGLTLSKAEGVGHVRGTPIFRIPPHDHPDRRGLDDDPPVPLHMALGKEVILLGNPVELVKGAIERFSTGAASLADDPRFLEAQASRQGSLLFAYLGSGRIWEAIREDAHAASAPALGALESVLGFEGIGPIHASLARATSSDILRLSLRARLEGPAAPAWKALATPPIDPSFLRAVPAGSLAFASTRLEGGLERWESVRSALGAVLDAVPPGEGEKARRDVEKIDRFLSEGAGRTFLEEIDAIGAGTVEGEGSPIESAFLLLRFRQAARGERVLEDAMTAFLGGIFDNRASRVFGSATIEIDGRDVAVRSIEPAPGIVIRAVKLEEIFVVAAGEAPLRACAAAARGAEGAAREPLPPGASKVLHLRPSALLAAAGPRARHEARVLLGQVERALIATREGEGGLSVEIQVPDVTRTVRATLDRVAAELRKAR
jgi:hypothetical protein